MAFRCDHRSLPGLESKLGVSNLARYEDTKCNEITIYVDSDYSLPVLKKQINLSLFYQKKCHANVPWKTRFDLSNIFFKFF
jgi:hypothetical protein